MVKVVARPHNARLALVVVAVALAVAVVGPASVDAARDGATVGVVPASDRLCSSNQLAYTHTKQPHLALSEGNHSRPCTW